MLQDASTFRPVINGSNLGPYKTALIAAPHRQLRRTTVDGAATRLWRRKSSSTAVPQLDCGAATQINCGAARPVNLKSSPIIEECCCKRGMPQ